MVRNTAHIHVTKSLLATAPGPFAGAEQSASTEFLYRAMALLNGSTPS
jgi:hypothetical protein